MPYEMTANAAVHYALKRGVLVRPDRCQDCGAPCKPDGHHPDHSKPLEVEWLCKKCHGTRPRKRSSFDVAGVTESGFATVAVAAREIGVHPGTVWRYLERRLLARYRSRGAGRPRTMVDMRELRQLLEHPPAEKVDE